MSQPQEYKKIDLETIQKLFFKEKSTLPRGMVNKKSRSTFDNFNKLHKDGTKNLQDGYVDHEYMVDVASNKTNTTDIQSSRTYRILLKYVFDILSKKDYSTREILDKMLAKANKLDLKNIDIEINKILELLKTKKFLDEKRLAENITIYYMARGFGKLIINQKMKRRKIEEQVIYEISSKRIEDIDDSHNQNSTINLLTKKITQKYGNMKEILEEPKLQNKVLGYLMRKGHGFDIWNKIKKDSLTK